MVIDMFLSLNLNERMCLVVGVNGSGSHLTSDQATTTCFNSCKHTEILHHSENSFNQRTNGPVNAQLISGLTISTMKKGNKQCLYDTPRTVMVDKENYVGIQKAIKICRRQVFS